MRQEEMIKTVKKYSFVLFTVILICIGSILLLNSVDMGVNSANDYLNTAMGGWMDTESFLIIQKGYIFSYLLVGGIFLLVGLLFFCIFLYKFLLKDIDLDKL